MSPAVAFAYPPDRALSFIFLLLLIGTQGAAELIRSTLPGTDLATRAAERVARAAVPVVFVLLALVVIRGALQVLTFVDADDPLTMAMVSGLLFHGEWGDAWMVQAGALVVLAAWVAARPIGRTGAWTLLLVAIVVGAQTGMGHSAGDVWPGPIGHLLDGVHLLGAGIWLGTLAILLALVLPILRSGAPVVATARMVQRYSIYARTGVILIVVTGVIEAVVYARSWHLFITATWGRLLIAKVIVMLGVLALGGYNWRVVTPALERGDEASIPRLERAIRIELLLGLVLLCITAFLVATALPGES